jgi:hypothetical protein
MATYKPLQSAVLTASASSVTFSGIDQSYTDLVLVTNQKVSAGTDTKFYFNGDTSSTLYSHTILYGTGSVAGSARESAKNYITFSWYSSPTTDFNHISIVNIMNYSNATTYKTTIGRGNNVTTGTDAIVGLWRNTAAITSITATALASTFSIGTTFSLYGIKSGAPQALGGDVVVTDGTYWYHAFKSTSSFTPLKTLSADVLIVAGGGGGGGTGNGIAGGGGAGGLRLLASQSIPGVQHTVTVGAGGTGGLTSGTYYGSNGINSSIIGTGLSLSATGGGAGGANSASTNLTGQAGGSGGGGSSGYTYGTGNAGGYSPVEGYRGGTGVVNLNSSGGGGGAGAVGADSNATRSSGGGAGGVGAGGVSYTNYAILNAMGAATSTGVLSSSNYYYAGGGSGGGYYDGAQVAGGTGGGGTGGGGTGSSNLPASAGTVNTGGGGGGAGNYNAFGNGNYVGGAGGSGIVIVRYAV